MNHLPTANFPSLKEAATIEQTRKKRTITREQQKAAVAAQGQLPSTINYNEAPGSSTKRQAENLTAVVTQAVKEEPKAENNALVEEGMQGLNSQAVDEKIDPTTTLADKSQDGPSAIPQEESKQLDPMSSVSPAPTLQDLASDLSAEAQQNFEKILQERQKEAAGLESIYASSNKRYAGQKMLMSKAETREEFCSLRETEKAQYQQLLSTYNKETKPSCLERIKHLENAITKLVIEQALLQHTIIGNNSYWHSFSLLKRELGFLYGANYRLGELKKEGLEVRKIALGIKEKELPGTQTIESAALNPSKIRQDLAKLSTDIDVLKEEVTICNEAFRKEAYEAVHKSEQPRKYYIYHKQQLEKLKASFASLKGDFEKRIEELNTEIQGESSTPTSSQSLAYNQEHKELTTRYEQFLVRQQEIEDLLNRRKLHFEIKEEGLDSKDPIQLEFLSHEYSQAAKLIESIITLKENVLLSNSWECFATPGERRSTYFKLVHEADEIEGKKNEFETKTFHQRSQMISEAILTHQRFINNIQTSTQATVSHFNAIAKYATERATWQVDPPSLKVAVTPNQTEGRDISSTPSSSNSNTVASSSDIASTREDKVSVEGATR